MIKQNLEEYKYLRDELEKLKSCITSYVGFLFVIVGGAFWMAVVAIAKDVQPQAATSQMTTLVVAYIGMFFCFLLASMISVLLYKFASHNRFVGFLLCITREFFKEEPQKQIDVILLWEPAMDCSRYIDLTAEELMWHEKNDHTRTLDSLKDTCSEIEKLIKQNSRIDCSADNTNHFMTYLETASKALTMKQKTLSWGFPVTVIRVYMIFLFVFNLSVAVSVVLLLIDASLVNLLHSMALIILFVLETIFVYQLLKRYHEIARGKRTIISFYIKFKAIRKVLLKRYYNINVDYF